MVRDLLAEAILGIICVVFDDFSQAVVWNSGKKIKL